MLKNLFHRLRAGATAEAPGPAAVPSTNDIAAADALIVRGNVLEDAGDAAQAEQLYREAVAKAPSHPRAHLNLGIVLAAKDDREGAAKAYEAVLALDPSHPFGNYNFARLLFIHKELRRAGELLDAALRAKPDFPQALVLRASVLDAMDKLPEAVEALEAANRLQPEDAGAWFNLALLNFKLERHDAAEAAVDRLLALAPRHPGALALRSRVMWDHNFVDEVLAPLARSVREDASNFALRSQELMVLNFSEGASAAELADRHREYGVDLEHAHPVRFDRFLGDRDPQRRLRIGYVSADFCLHPVALFMKPVLESHRRDGFEIFCYSSVGSPDHVTEECRAISDHWRQVEAMSDSELADAIHADAIDILVDLTGHTASPRLPTFSQRPAPVQVSWVGYLNTTGMTRMDYRLTDFRCDPPELSQPLHTERLVFLPDSQWCYRPFVESAPSVAAPCERNGFITFGSFNPLLGGNVLANGTITMTCGANSGNGYYDVVLSAGGSGNYQARQMKSGSNSLSYNLYSDSAHTKVWQPDNCGGNCGVMGFSNTSVNGGTMTFTVYGEIPAQPKAIPGTYGDSITVTLTY